jgi:hypothetical protein
MAIARNEMGVEWGVLLCSVGDNVAKSLSYSVITVLNVERIISKLMIVI